MDKNQNRNYSVKWYKDCLLYQKNELKLTFNDLKDLHAGNYTCIITFLYNGKEYNYSRTTHLKLQASEEILKPGILGDSPKQVVEIEHMERGKCLKGLLFCMRVPLTA
ncbi:interleukin-1 receptor type 2-like [Pleurodeles waltl]|uniref:interleukin-1 receptor type 2-like n=1 Tax=Pleurodeles waltl TaxID=8319 RepID=UPI0037096660